MDNKSYKTKQRESLLEFFKENKENCFLAKDIIKNAKLSLGEATIYRTLSKFVEEGLLKKFISSDGSGSYYQYNEGRDECASHFHLKCTKCGTLFHMDCSFLKDMTQHINLEHGFNVDNSKTTLYGTCKNCG
mgnify:CR=1 FL=1